MLVCAYDNANMSRNVIVFGFAHPWCHQYETIKPSPTSKHGRICPLASRILQKHTHIFKYDVFWKSVFVLNTPKYAYLDVLWNIKYVRSYFVIFSKTMKYAVVFILTNMFKCPYVCWLRINMRIRPYLPTSQANKC